MIKSCVFSSVLRFIAFMVIYTTFKNKRKFGASGAFKRHIKSKHYKNIRIKDVSDRVREALDIPTAQKIIEENIL